MPKVTIKKMKREITKSSLIKTFLLVMGGWVFTLQPYLVVNAQCSQGACGSLDINRCLGTISSSSATGLLTSSGSSQITMQCGSENTGLRDHISQFAVTTSGLYTIKTFSISGDTTLQVQTCGSSPTILACNDDVNSNDRSSLVTVPLESGNQYSASVSKFNSNSNEVTFGLSISPVCVCAEESIDECFGVVQPATGLVKTGLSTSGKTSKKQMSCGSEQSGLRDFAFQFEVAANGVYSVSTEDVSGDTTLSLFTCSGNELACNDDKVAEVDFSSRVQANLQKGVTYLGLVSKHDSNKDEVSFSVSIQLVTNTPTTSPTLGPTASPTTEAPSLAPSQSPSMPQPTTSPAVVTPEPTIDVGGGVTKSPEGGDAAPSISEDQTDFVGIGGGIGGGAIVIAALGVIMRRRSVRRRQTMIEQTTWTPNEEEKLRRLYQSTHDLDVLLSAFPNKTRESVAMKLRGLLKESQSMTTSTGLAPSTGNTDEGFTFVRNAVPVASTMRPASALHVSNSNRMTVKLKSAVSSVSSFSSRIASTSMAAFRPKPVPPPPGLAHMVNSTADNPIFTPPVAPTRPTPPPFLTPYNARYSVDPSMIPPPPPYLDV